MFRKISRAFSEAFQGMFRHFAMASSSALAVTITLILVSLLTLVIGNVAQITKNIENDIQIFAKIDNSVAEEDIKDLQAKIESIDSVTHVSYSDRDNELDKFIAEYGESGSIFEIYRQDNPLSRAFIVTVVAGTSLVDVSNKISATPGMGAVDFGGSTTEDFIGVLNSVRDGGYIIVLALTVLAVFLIYNTIKITIDSRKEEIAIMRFVGATNGSIRAPLVIEGIFIGLFGAIIPIVLTIFGYQYVYNLLGGQLISGIMTLLPVYPFVYVVAMFLAVLGCFVGLMGSFLSATKFLRWKR